MQIKKQYSTPEERQALLEEYADLFLIEEQVLFEGNFLIFSDKPLEIRKVYTQVDEEEFNAIKQENTTLKLALAELAETHEQTKLEIQLALAELAEKIVGGE